MIDSVFSKIIRGEIPCHKVYEDDKTFAFLDINPLLPGHVLVVPKTEVDDFELLPQEDYSALFATVRRLSKSVKRVFNTKKAVVMIMGYDVPHAHVHILPSNSSEIFYDAVEKRAEKKRINHDELAKIAQELRNA